MYWFLFGVFVGLPLAGLYTLPHTATTASAALAYLAHLAVIAAAAGATYAVLRRRFPELRDLRPPVVERDDYRRLARRTLVVQLVIFVYLLLGLGAIQVLTGQVGRGEFRSSFGGTGFVLAFVVKWFSPAILGLTALRYRFLVRPVTPDRALLVANFAVVMAAGASLGFKSSIVRLVLPGLLAVFWRRLNLTRVVAVTALSFALMTAAGSYFAGWSLQKAATYNVYRATAVTMRTAKVFWDDHRDGIGPVAYSKTLLNALGDQNVTMLTGIPAGSEQYVQFSLAQQMTLFEFPGEAEKAYSGAFNVTGTVWGEGILAFGVPGYLVFSLVAGVLAAAIYSLWTVAIGRGAHPLAATLATFYALPFLGWMNNGVLSTVVHVLTIAGAVVTFYVCRTVLGSPAVAVSSFGHGARHPGWLVPQDHDRPAQRAAGSSTGTDHGVDADRTALTGRRLPIEPSFMLGTSTSR